jgi:branched-chain amino acid transport system ATP-binding protein
LPTLSGGEQQRAHFASVLVQLACGEAMHGPGLLLLDEPTAGMTPEETSMTARFLVDLNQRGLAILVVEHDMAFVRQIGRKVTVLHYGRIFSEGTLDEIEANKEVRRIYLGEQ